MFVCIFACKNLDAILSIEFYHLDSIQTGIKVMAVRVVEFSNGGYKIRKVFAYESIYSKGIIEF